MTTEGKKILFNAGDPVHSFLSNLHPCTFKFAGNLYKSAEHYYQAQKAMNRRAFRAIVDSVNGWEAMKLGKSIQKPSDWDQYRDDVMRDALFLKFMQNPTLAKMLVETDGYQLCEDTKHPHWSQSGENMLGKLLEELREWLVGEWQDILT